jgi:hypothetical protein
VVEWWWVVGVVVGGGDMGRWGVALVVA